MEEEKFISQGYWTPNTIKNEVIIEKLAKLFALRDDEFTPTRLYGGKYTKKRNQKYDISMVEKFKEIVLAPDSCYVVLTNSDRFKRDMLFGVRIHMTNTFCLVNMSATHSYFKRKENLEKFLAIGKKIAAAINPIYGCVHDIEDKNNIMGGKVFKPLEFIPAAFWGNYFGKHYIDKIDKQKLLSFSGFKVEELNNGDIFIQTTESPLNPTSSKDRKAQRELAKLMRIKRQGSVFTETINGIFNK